MAEENRVGLLRSALAAGTYLRITSMQVSDVGDGDGFVEAGETAEVEVTLRNSGRSGTGTSVVGTLTTASPLATAGAGSFDFGPIGSFANAGNPGSPLTLAIDPSAQPGDEIPYRLELAADGTVFPIELVLVVGRRFDYVDDPLEIDLGWTVGDPSDTATTGIWELADPIATDYQGEPLNPGEDAGAGAETQCFVTGNGGGSSGTDDVDGGTTTLYSPPFDLSAATVAYAGYSRWWANLAFNDDSMRVEVTGDGGGSWVLLEEIVNTQNAWTPAEFRLNDFVALTADVQLRFLASDGGSGSLTEAGVDDFSLSIYDDRPRLAVYGSQTTGTPVALNLTGEPGDAYAHLWSPGTGVLPLPGITGDFLLDPLQFFVPFQGTIPASGTRERILPIPPDPTLVGATVWWQSLVTGASETWLTNREPMTFD
jgi:hypothetical protein